MKKCNVCGFECEDELNTCPTCGRNTDGSDNMKNPSKAVDPFERYRKEIDEQIKQQEKRIADLQEKMKAEKEESETPKKKKEKLFDEYDKTELFEETDVNEHRFFAILIYLTGVVGIILALLKDKNSPYLKFHIQEGIKIVTLDALVLILSAILSWTVIVPILGIMTLLTSTVIKLTSTFWTYKGLTKNAIIIRKIII